MLVLSDMSGVSMTRGFENYLTSYPLKEINSYALARTWYAPEMRRPGCVWTHTFLISNADLAHFDPFVLQNSFVRPTTDSTSWAEYTRPYLTDDSSPNNLPTRINEPAVSRNLARNVIGALYNSPRSQVFLPQVVTSTATEILTLTIWAQQWARLRRSFSFCTGAMTNRQFPGADFDWQVIPPSAADEIKRENSKAVFIEAEKASDILQNTKRSFWLEAAVEDLYESHPMGLRSFLRIFGAEKRRGRRDFKPLAKIYALSERVRQDAKSISEFIEFVAGLYPSPHQGKHLKRAFFAARDESAGELARVSLDANESVLLEELAQTEHSAAFDADDLQISLRTAALTKSDFDRSSKIARSILGSRLTALGEVFLDGFCQSLTASEVLSFSADNSSVILPIINRKPSLLASGELWKSSEKTQQDLFDYVRRHLSADDALIGQIVTAMLDTESDLIADKIAYFYPEIVVDRVLCWCDSLPIEKSLDIGREWKSILSKRARLSLNWLRNNHRGNLSTRILLALLLDPHSYEVHRGGTGIWLELARTANEVGDDKVYVAVMSFLLALGFDNPDVNAVQLVVEAFEPVHTAAQQNRLNEHNWNLLAGQAPAVTWDGGWNRCERLRNALVERFMWYDWSREEFLECLKNPNLLEKIIVQVWKRKRWFNSQRKYLEKTAQRVFASEISASSAQKEVLHKILE